MAGAWPPAHPDGIPATHLKTAHRCEQRRFHPAAGQDRRRPAPRQTPYDGAHGRGAAAAGDGLCPTDPPQTISRWFPMPPHGSSPAEWRVTAVPAWTYLHRDCRSSANCARRWLPPPTHAGCSPAPPHPEDQEVPPSPPPESKQPQGTVRSRPSGAPSGQPHPVRRTLSNRRPVSPLQHFPPARTAAGPPPDGRPMPWAERRQYHAPHL